MQKLQREIIESSQFRKPQKLPIVNLISMETKEVREYSSRYRCRYSFRIPQNVKRIGNVFNRIGLVINSL